MITVIKQNAQGKIKLRYEANVLERRPDGVVLQAEWTWPTRELDYTRFETGDHFLEYFYTNCWFNIFKITSVQGQLKGWYCDIAEPARIRENEIEQVDLEMDVWINPAGEIIILDEDEFVAADLTQAQRQGAEQGLEELLHMLEAREDAFADLKIKL
jgi:protein associated with RNAse G/E